jgi:hypothetical protein
VKKGIEVSTTEQLSEIVKKVRIATESLSGDDQHLREIAFEKLIEHELGYQAYPPGTNGEGRQSQSADEQVDTSYATLDMRADAVGRYFDISSEDARDLFDLSSEEPVLQAPSGSLQKSTAGAVREIALLVCGVRTALGLETGSRHIREVADEYKRFDGNFNKHLTDFDLIAVRGKTRSPNRLVRMRVIGAEAARVLAQRLVSNGG